MKFSKVEMQSKLNEAKWEANCMVILATSRQLVFLIWKKGDKHSLEQIIVAILETILG